MAKRVIEQFVDDLDGTVLEDDAETVRFGLDGTSYEIDLSPANAAALRSDFAKYVGAARRSGGGAPARRRRTGGGADTAAIREWAREKGIDVPTRGRLPKSVLDAYGAEH
ncbi:histone-like nucleoid-structuring protein Lsr2 [Agromyces sp. SYSU T00194]|uniref:histone-like nucleoid-structuring protein Lsr2 n=1 Tax=Agromyces chitinivorans TaxID=3158560 RepID=UPI003393E8E0